MQFRKLHGSHAPATPQHGKAMKRTGVSSLRMLSISLKCRDVMGSSGQLCDPGTYLGAHSQSAVNRAHSNHHRQHSSKKTEKQYRRYLGAHNTPQCTEATSHKIAHYTRHTAVCRGNEPRGCNRETNAEAATQLVKSDAKERAERRPHGR